MTNTADDLIWQVKKLCEWKEHPYLRLASLVSETFLLRWKNVMNGFGKIKG